MTKSNRTRRSTQLSTLALSLALVFSSADSSAFARTNEFQPNAPARVREIHLSEPLVAAWPGDEVDDAALATSLKVYEARTSPGDVGALAAFVEAYPNSAWGPALLTDLGISYFHQGRFSQAIAAWRAAWDRGRTAEQPEAKALVDRSVGELAQLYASLGHFEALEAFFRDIGDRPITGSATEMVQNAREMLDLSSKDPRHLFICGPLALKALLLAEGARPEDVDYLQWVRASSQGTSLAQVADMAGKAHLSYRLVFRAKSKPVPVPSIIHWQVGHFAAVVGQANGRFHIQDSTLGGAGIWVTEAAIDAEASGYFLVPDEVGAHEGWTPVVLAEAEQVWGKGPTNQSRLGDSGDPPSNSQDPDPGNPPNPNPGRWPDPNYPPNPTSSNPDQEPPQCGMCGYGIKESSVSITLSDTPVGYAPPIGPDARTRITYNQREDSQPAVFSFFNVSPKWTLNWLSYVTDDPTNPGGNVSRYLSGGGSFYYLGYNAPAGTFAPQDDDGSILTLASQSPVSYRRQMRDGSVEIYAQSDGSTGYPRNVFLSRRVDPQGNGLTFAYDAQKRLTSLTDATGRQTTLTYGLAFRPLLVTQVTDPFGRSAKLSYDGSGRLASITDTIGITSSFAYDANALVNALTTPYGTTTFNYTAPGTSGPPRFAQATDPLGLNEREEWLEPAPIPESDPAATVPQGMPIAPTNQYLTYRNSFHWDKDAYLLAGCTPTGGCDYTKARIRHFVHMPNSSTKGTAIESVKYPLENRIWYNYPGQTSSIYGGTSNRPIAIGRVLDDGTTQLSQFTYDTSGFNLTKAVDPLGRTTQYTYAPNGIDLFAKTQTTADGLTTFAQYAYDGRHRPIVTTDASGQSRFFAYNGVGQLTSVTNPLGQTTRLAYDTTSNISTVTNANNQTAATLTYDSANRVRTATDSEGWTLTYDYDAADRITAITYPDGTSQAYTYDRLDLAAFRDRQSRAWRYAYDADRRLTTITDPLGQNILLAYNGKNQLTSLTDPKGYVTTWTYDIQGRPTGKQYADTSTVTYAYESTISRLHSFTDALNQVKSLAYAEDNRLTGITYSNALNPTPNLSFAWDTYVARATAMTDGTGTTSYTYGDAFALGASQLKRECFVPTGGTLCTATIDYGYDAVGRLASRGVRGAIPETFAYDALGRVSQHGSDLGSFALSYLGQTGQITTRQLLPATSNLATTWSYLPNSGDRRLASIGNTGLSAGQFSNFAFSTTPENQIAAITETSDASAVYPPALTQTASYNDLNEQTDISGQARTYDLNGNLTSDGLRAYSWDAENRLVGITYPGSLGKATAFTYDGLDRRVAIASTPAGGGTATTTSYVWCGSAICQSRNASGARIRSYYREGEFVAGTPGQSQYYAPDQIGSVRRAFSASSAPAFTYDPYGVPLGSTTPTTDFTYAGMLNSPESGLYLTQYRAYDPIGGIWISRDPLAELAQSVDTNDGTLLTNEDSLGPAASTTGALRQKQVNFSVNLYNYVSEDPVNFSDRRGLAIVPSGLLPGGIPDPFCPAASFGHGSRHVDPLIAPGLQDAISRALPPALPLGIYGMGTIFYEGQAYEFRYYGLGNDVNVGTYFPSR